MNIVFEGVDASGKTTLIDSFSELLDSKNEKYTMINELKESPLSDVLQNMFNNDPFLLSNEKFNTSMYETLVLAADYYYKKEYTKKYKDQLVLFDRNLLTILVYQKAILEDNYKSLYKKLYNPFKEMMMADTNDNELIAYVSIPVEMSVERIIKRQREKLYNKDQIEFLRKIKRIYEEEIIPEFTSLGKNIILLDGRDDPKENSNKIYNRILKR